MIAKRLQPDMMSVGEMNGFIAALADLLIDAYDVPGLMEHVDAIEYYLGVHKSVKEMCDD